jgi:hypothetical protein
MCSYSSAEFLKSCAAIVNGAPERSRSYSGLLKKESLFREI